MVEFEYYQMLNKHVRRDIRMFLNHFMIGFIASSFSIIVILVMKKLFKNHLSAKWHYHLWYILFIVLMIPFIPLHIFNINEHFHFRTIENEIQTRSLTAQEGHKTGETFNWIEDFSVTVNQPDLSLLNVLLATIWLGGMLFFVCVTLKAWFSIRNIKKYSVQLTDRETIKVFEVCKKRLGISRNIKVVVSPHITSPMMYGLFQTYVVLPSSFQLSKKEMEHIFLHELNHYKNNDILINYFSIAFQIVYWFNPLVWLAFKKMRLDREIACDMAVLQSLESDAHRDYGYTLINFIDKGMFKRKFTLANLLNGSKEQMKKRIEQIASYSPQAKSSKWKSFFIFSFISIVIATQLPFISVFAEENNRYYNIEDKTVYEDLSKYFSGFEGSFVLYDQNKDQYRIYNEDKSSLRVSPDSTYKIYSGLIALESNIITRDSSTLTWDGKENPYPAWNMNQDLESALKNSVNWYFQQLDKENSLETIETFLKELGYGNENISGGIDSFWLESSLKISPLEQVNVLHDFYTNHFSFNEDNVNTVKDALRLEEKPGRVLSGKTGTGNVNGVNIRGWFVGYVETDDNTFFFASYIENHGNAAGSKAAEIALSILADKGIY